MKSSIKKLFKFLKAAYQNKQTIYDSLIAALKANEADIKLAQRRLDTCRKCPHYSKNTSKRPYGYLPFNSHCTKCGCSIALKKYSKTNTCPLKIWEK